jgi:hypothetical protein
MTRAISDLTRATALSSADLVPMSSANDRDTRAMALDLLREWMQANLTFTGASLTQQFAAPSATGFSVTVALADSWLVLTPVAGYAAGTIVLPTIRADGQVVQVNCTQAVTALTVSGAGTTVTGAPTTLAANAFFRLQYSATLNAWFRVG